MNNWFFGSPILGPSVREDGGASNYVDVIWRLTSWDYAEDAPRMRKGREIQSLRKHTLQLYEAVGRSQSSGLINDNIV